MDVVVAGGHGKVAQHLLRLLSADGHRARGLIRNPGHAADLEALGAQAVVADLEQGPVTEHVAGADALVFAAGAGPGSGPERKRTVDLGGAVRLIEAAEANGIRRYVMVSSIGAEDPAAGPESMHPYLEAKAEADAALRESGLDWTIVRPGMLTDDPPTGRITATLESGLRAEVPRADVAATLLAALLTDTTIAKTFVVVGGETPVDEAVRAL